MSKLLVAIVIYSILIVSAILAFLYFDNDNDLDIEEGLNKVHQLDEVLLLEHGTQDNEAGYNLKDNFVMMFRDIEETLTFFVAVLKEENVEYFSSLFVPQQFANDLWNYSATEPYLNNTELKLIKELNRDGKLVTARFDTSLLDGYKRTREETDVKLYLIYEDGMEVELNLNFVLIGTQHNNKDEIFYIENSILDIIDEVRKQIT